MPAARMPGVVQLHRGPRPRCSGSARWPLDVRSGLSLGTGADARTLYVTGGVQITGVHPLLVQGASVDPSDSRLFISTFGMSGYGGVPLAATNIIDVASNSQATIDGFR